jgi:hypothetical protein
MFRLWLLSKFEQCYQSCNLIWRNWINKWILSKQRTCFGFSTVCCYDMRYLEQWIPNKQEIQWNSSSSVRVSVRLIWNYQLRFYGLAACEWQKDNTNARKIGNLTRSIQYNDKLRYKLRSNYTFCNQTNQYVRSLPTNFTIGNWKHCNLRFVHPSLGNLISWGHVTSRHQGISAAGVGRRYCNSLGTRLNVGLEAANQLLLHY